MKFSGIAELITIEEQEKKTEFQERVRIEFDNCSTPYLYFHLENINFWPLKKFSIPEKLFNQFVGGPSEEEKLRISKVYLELSSDQHE